MRTVLHTITYLRLPAYHYKLYNKIK